MQRSDWENVFNLAKQWVLESGELIRNSFSNKLTINFKGNPADLVTNMDKQVEQYLIKHIKETFPSHRVLGEEGHGDEVSSLDGTVWIIDPIDGTTNFVHMQRHFAISVGVYHNGEGLIGLIYDVVADDLYYAMKGKGAFVNEQQLPSLETVPIREAVLGMSASWAIEEKRIDRGIIPPLLRDLRGTRSFGSATIELAYVASGKIDGYFSLRLSPWDFAAGKVIIEEVGGKITSINGEPLGMLNRQIPVLAAKPGLHEVIVKDYFHK